MNITGYEQYHITDRPDSSDFPYSFQICTLYPEEPVIPLHWHERMELIRIRKGRGLVTIDLEPFPAEEGTVFIIAPGQLHSILSDAKEPLEYENITFSLDMLEGKGEDLCTKDYFEPLSKDSTGLPCCITPKTDWYAAFSACLDETRDLGRYFPIAYPLAIKSRLFQMFYILFYNETPRLPKTRPQKSLDKSKFILEYVNSRYTERISIPKMAEACGLSESHFMKFFKSVVGMTFTEYINDYRLRTGARLLSESSIPVQEAASACGIPNGSYFNRLFRRKYRMTPTEFRTRT